MQDDPDPREKAHCNDEDEARTEETRRLVEDYASGLREMLSKFRKWFH